MWSYKRNDNAGPLFTNILTSKALYLRNENKYRKQNILTRFIP